MFYGFVFTIDKDASKVATVVAYDQLRYLTNRDTYIFRKKTATEIVKKIAKDFRLKTGSIADTKYVIKSRVEENATLFDIVQNALNITNSNTGKRYILYDDKGKLVLKDISKNYVNCKIDSESLTDFKDHDTIDEETYTRVRLIYQDMRKKVRKFYVKSNEKAIQKWGVLQYYEHISENDNGNEKAKKLLDKYDKNTKTLSLTNVIGNKYVRAGTKVYVTNIGVKKTNKYMLVERCLHKYKDGEHFMDLSVSGGGFVE